MKEQSENIEQAGSASEAKQEKRQKRGETPRQQIHKAKKVTPRRFSAEDKIGCKWRSKTEAGGSRKVKHLMDL